MPKTVLVVDDSPTEMHLIVSTLQKKGYKVMTSVDGDEAIQKIAQERPDLILLDVVMPKKNGFQVCRQIKTTPATKDIKIIMCTSKNQEFDRVWGLKQGADEYLTKPFKEQELLDIVARHI